MRQHRLALAPTDDSADINLTPMLDVVFIMLIFFLVTASFIKEIGLDISPANAPVEPTDAADNLLIVIEASGVIRVDGRAVDARALPAYIIRTKTELPAASIIIDAHDHSPTGVLVTVIDAARLAGVDDYQLAAR